MGIVRRYDDTQRPMTNQAQKHKRVLFVDDDPQFLETIERVIRGSSRGHWDVFFADNAGKALSVLSETPIDLVVADVQMPVVDGVQFLRLLHRRFPNLQKVALTGFANESVRAACLDAGAELFLEKPRTGAGMESVIATLEELSRWQTEEDGFRGVLRRASLEDVIQMECLSRHSVVLWVEAGELRGEIFIKEGAIVHAQAKDKSGIAAFNYLLSLRGGEFVMQPFAEPPAATMDDSWEMLIMEAARLRDEETSASPSPADGSAETLEADLPSTPVRTAPASPASDPAKAAPARIEEVLICSGEGEVLYEWQCFNTDERVNFLEVISQKSRQLAQGLELGQFDRLELETPQARLIAQVRNDRGILVRLRGPGDEGA